MEDHTSKLLAYIFAIGGGLTDRAVNGLCNYDWMGLLQTLLVAVACGFAGAVGHGIYRKIFKKQ